MSADRKSLGSAATWCAIAVAAYFVADVAHEGLGHGGACLALGGRMLLLDTTFEDCSIHSRLIDGAGPVVGIIVAMLAYAWLRFAPPRAAAIRIFLCLVFAFAGFWNVGYLIKSGLTDQGDWAFVIAGLAPAKLWHIGITILGIVLYAAAMRILGAMIFRALPSEDGVGMRPLAFALTAYVAAALLSAAAGYFDPRGPMTILTDALPSSLGAVGLVWVGFEMNRRLPTFRVAVPSSTIWIAAGCVLAVIFIAILGPGWRGGA